MVAKDTRRAVVAGTVITVIGFVLPYGYAYAPMVGGFVAGAMRRRVAAGARTGATLGLVFVPVGLGLVAISLALPATVETGIDALVRSMRGMGPKNAVFYLVVVYFVATYTALAGGVFGAVSGALSAAIRA